MVCFLLCRKNCILADEMRPQENHPVHHDSFQKYSSGASHGHFPHHRPALHHHQLGGGSFRAWTGSGAIVYPRQSDQQADDPAVRDGVQAQGGPRHRRARGSLPSCSQQPLHPLSSRVQCLRGDYCWFTSVGSHVLIREGRRLLLPGNFICDETQN